MENKPFGTASSKRAERTTDLIANFVKGFADGWHMALRECFKMELDIKLTERKKDNVSYYEWTQGPYFCFSEGQIIYDSKNGYSSWQDALKNINLACQVVSAKPNIPIKVKNEVTGKYESRVLAGYVQFVLSKPDEDRTKLVPYIGYKLSQDEFVDFLKGGKL